jgi:hypothetical protein
VYEIRSIEENVAPAVPVEVVAENVEEQGAAAAQEPEPPPAEIPAVLAAPEPAPEPMPEIIAVLDVPEPEPVPPEIPVALAAPEPEQPPAELRAAPAVRTVTLADIYWLQGEHSTARRIIGEILRSDPANLRAQAWLAARTGDDLMESELLGFLETIAKEYRYDLS